LDEAAAFDESAPWRPPNWFDQVEVALLQTTDAVNIGGVVRAMANTGFTRLRLVDPAPYDPWDVVGVAHYTQHIVQAATVFADLRTAVADAHLVVGLTGKHYREKRNATPFRAALDEVQQRAQSGSRVILLFGREDTGLSNEALDRCHLVTTIPTNPAYPSLNLAQAALLTLYTLFQRGEGDQQVLRVPRRNGPPASSALLEDFFADLERALEAIDFLKKRPRPSTLRSLRGIFYRAALDTREASLLRAAVIEVRHYLHRHGLLDEVGPVGRQP
jgi:TrmH family RNA methyltransferase